MIRRGGGGRETDGTARYEDELSTKVRTDRAPAIAVAPSFLVAVVDGPDRGARFSIDGAGVGRVLVGQSPACAIRLSDRLVSRRHAALVQQTSSPELRLSDLGSRNGTFVNDVRVADAFLRGGEIVRMGDTALAIELVEEAGTVPLSSATSFGRVIGASVEMRRLYPLFERIAASDVPVVIEGETGTGKEVLAESLHLAGRRADRPFVVFDCTTVAPSLVEAELFGYERGAFTGAVAKRKGLFELADGGTLFIDEIGDLDLALQAKLLRAIQRSEIRRIGGERYIKVDVRIIAATRRDLDVEVQEGRFRDDLFFRLAVARVELPPLRERASDIALLAGHFWKELGGGDRPMPWELVQRFESYRWPGNVRELHNEIARCVALGDLESAARRRGGARAAAPPPEPPAAAREDFIESVLALDLPLVRARQRVVDEFQRRYVERVLAKHGGNVTRAAAASGIAHRYFQILRARQGK